MTLRHTPYNLENFGEGSFVGESLESLTGDTLLQLSRWVGGVMHIMVHEVGMSGRLCCTKWVAAILDLVRF